MFCTCTGFVFFDALWKIALHKTEVVFCMMKSRFEVYQINHKKAFKRKKDKKKALLEAGCRSQKETE